MAVDEKGYTKYEPLFDARAAAKRRLAIIQQNETTSDAYSNFKSQLDTNQASFNEQMQIRQAGLNSLGIGSRNADSLSQYGADLLGRVQAQFNYTPASGLSAGLQLGGGGSVGGASPAGEFGAFTRAIAHHESGGSYSAVNKHSGALGKYQIMPFNIASWSQAALGRTITPSQFLSSPQYQEQIAQHRLKIYYDQYGPAGAAVAWYAGPGAAQNFVRSGYASRNMEANGYPSVYSYVGNIMGTMRSYL